MIVVSEAQGQLLLTDKSSADPKKKFNINKKAAGGVAAGLVALAGMGLIVKKIKKANPGSEVVKEAEKRIKALQKDMKAAQKELKKASTPAEEKAANKKIASLEKQLNKLKSQIGKLADKNLEPQEVEKIKSSLQRMVAESVAPEYTISELMITELYESVRATMEDHYELLAMEATKNEAAEMEDIFGEDVDDIFGPEFEESAIDDLFEDDFDWE